MDFDWLRFSETAEHYATLSPEEADAFLQTLAEDDADLATAVQAWNERKSKARSFMQTSVPSGGKYQAPALPQGDRIGAWQIDELLGAGGMGEVYKASRADGGFDQLVALKLARKSGKSFVARFERERQRLAALDHPGIARIVDGGESEKGSPYMTMEFVDGQPITTYAKDNGLGRDKRLMLVEELCAALSHAHSRLILHCDIKPDNVLVNQDGVVRLIDFGVASLVGEDDQQPGALTLAFAAPEQLRREPVSTATDIFAVGMLMHLIESGHLPARQPDGSVRVDQGRIDDADLAAIIAKATAADVEDRYASVGVLAEDIAEFRGGFPVSARTLTPMQRFGKGISRNRVASALAGALVLALSGGLLTSLVFYSQAKAENERYEISQKQGSALIEFFETSDQGFGQFAAGLGRDSEAQRVLIAELEKLEAKADAMDDDPAGAAAIYVFLSDFYADAGMFDRTGNVAQKLADPKFERNFSIATTLLNASLFVTTGEEMKQAPQWLDTAIEFFETAPKVHDYEIAWAKCLKSRLTNEDPDREDCLSTAQGYLAGADPVAETAVVSSRTIQAYAVDEAMKLDRLDEARDIAQGALAGYKTHQNFNQGGVPEVAFHLQMGKIENLSGNDEKAIAALQAGSTSINGQPRYAQFGMAIAMQLAAILNDAEEFDAALPEAQKALSTATEVIGPESAYAYNAKAQLARSLAGLGRKDEAIDLISEVIEFQAEFETNRDAIERNKGYLKSWTAP